MSSALLGLTLLAVGWLAIWSVKDHSKPSKTWWPFAMRDGAAPPDDGAEGTKGRATWRARTLPGKPVSRPWRRSGS